VGVVARVLALPSCEVLEVTRGDGGELLVPLVSDAVRVVDIQAREIDVDLSFLGES
jgi:16S rRNA processing protein RimM